jgi:hypothetical protein
MNTGKALAMERRNRGLPVGRPAKGWKFKRPAPQGLDRLEWEYNDWRKHHARQLIAAIEFDLYGDEWKDMEAL